MLRSRPWAIAAGLVLVLLLGLSDQASGPDLSFLIFYLVPVLLVSWYGGPGAGMFISLASTVAWFLANDEGRTTSLTPYWNAAGRLGMLLIVAYVLGRLRVAYDREKSLSRTDYLTGLANRRSFIEGLDLELARTRRYGRPLTLAYMDVDNFKQINDRLGHAVGDRVLQNVAAAMQEQTRQTDQIARLGGDEFALLLPETDAGAAQVILPRILDRLADVAHANGWAISFSVGAVTTAHPAPTLDGLMRAADTLMYSVKRDSKERVRYREVSESTEAAPPTALSA